MSFRSGRRIFQVVGHLHEGDGVGAVGGKGGEGPASDYFMMRIGMPNGIVTSSQLRVIADITRTHAHNLADITTRQNIQLHWLTIESIPEVVDALDRIGLSPKGACGDVVRNVTGCRSPVSLTTKLLMLRRWPRNWPMLSSRILSSTICRASSRCPRPAARFGAPIPRSTTLPSRRSSGQ